MTTENIQLSILCKGKIITFDTPRIMGILNITPDSFYGGSRYGNMKDIGNVVEKMLMDGAEWIDIGAVSTRPGSESADEETEKKRLEPVLGFICRNFPEALISVDTFRPDIASMAVEKYGAAIINDISAGEADKRMPATAARLKVPYIIMHMQGTPASMQEKHNTEYKDLVNDVIQFLAVKKEALSRQGVTDVIVDPGFGFSKTISQNYLLLKELKKFRILDCPLMAGLSRKSMIYKTLDASPGDALSGTLGAQMLALMNGADILRVHDVKEAADLVKIFKKYSLS
jgi:dihydropteroate synthase